MPVTNGKLAIDESVDVRHSATTATHNYPTSVEGPSAVWRRRVLPSPRPGPRPSAPMTKSTPMKIGAREICWRQSSTNNLVGQHVQPRSHHPYIVRRTEPRSCAVLLAISVMFRLFSGHSSGATCDVRSSSLASSSKEEARGAASPGSPRAGRCPPLCVLAVIDQPYPQSFDFSMLTSVGTG